MKPDFVFELYGTGVFCGCVAVDSERKKEIWLTKQKVML